MHIQCEIKAGICIHQTSQRVPSVEKLSLPLSSFAQKYVTMEVNSCC